MGCGSSTDGKDTSENTAQSAPDNRQNDDNRQSGGQGSKESKPSGGSTTSGQEKFCNEALDAHNTYRAKHGAPAMKLNPTLCQQAAEYAKKLAEANEFKHSTSEARKLNGQSVGENLAMNYGSAEPSGAAATKMWYDEVEKYNYNNPGFSMETGHFTQVVWKGSTELGIGYYAAKDDNWGQRIVTVGRYMPAGNMTSAFEANVTPN